MGFYAGIDGGGTQTTCAIGNATELLGIGRSGGSNVVKVGDADARVSLQTAIRQACDTANVNPCDIECTCVGVAGISALHVSDVVRRAVTEVVSGKVVVVGDNSIAMEAAFGRGGGVIVVSGTGSIAYGRNEQGQAARAGGYGHAISDEGSGLWIGRVALAAALREHDRGIQGRLLAALVAALGADSRESAVRIANAMPAPSFAKLVPTLVQAADDGDSVAIDVLNRAGHELAELAAIVIRQLWPDKHRVPVGRVGGIFRSSSHVRHAFGDRLNEKCAQVEIRESVVDPVMGALALARRGGDLDV